MIANPIPAYPRHWPALSIRQPWAWLIVHAGKNIENRSRRTHYKGRFLIHAAAGMTNREYEEAMDWIVNNDRIPLHFPEPEKAELQRGGIVGAATIVDCVMDSDSPWFTGGWGYVLRDATPIPFIPCKGKLGFFYPKF